MPKAPDVSRALRKSDRATKRSSKEKELRAEADEIRGNTITPRQETLVKRFQRARTNRDLRAAGVIFLAPFAGNAAASRGDLANIRASQIGGGLTAQDKARIIGDIADRENELLKELMKHYKSPAEQSFAVYEAQLKYAADILDAQARTVSASQQTRVAALVQGHRDEMNRLAEIRGLGSARETAMADFAAAGSEMRAAPQSIGSPIIAEDLYAMLGGYNRDDQIHLIPTLVNTYAQAAGYSSPEEMLAAMPDSDAEDAVENMLILGREQAGRVASRIEVETKALTEKFMEDVRKEAGVVGVKSAEAAFRHAAATAGEMAPVVGIPEAGGIMFAGQKIPKNDADQKLLELLSRPAVPKGAREIKAAIMGSPDFQAYKESRGVEDDDIAFRSLVRDGRRIREKTRRADRLALQGEGKKLGGFQPDVPAAALVGEEVPAGTATSGEASDTDEDGRLIPLKREKSSSPRIEPLASKTQAKPTRARPFQNVDLTDYRDILPEQSLDPFSYDERYPESPVDAVEPGTSVVPQTPAQAISPLSGGRYVKGGNIPATFTPEQLRQAARQGRPDLTANEFAGRGVIDTGQSSVVDPARQQALGYTDLGTDAAAYNEEAGVRARLGQSRVPPTTPEVVRRVRLRRPRRGFHRLQ